MCYSLSRLGGRVVYCFYGGGIVSIYGMTSSRMVPAGGWVGGIFMFLVG